MSAAEILATPDQVGESPRRIDIEAKQRFVAELLEELSSDGLLVLEPANVRWLTSGASSRGLRGTDEEPGLFFNAEQRWILSSNIDSQRLFDEELDELGFQLKEWAWAVGKRRLLDEMTRDRQAICDRTFGTCDTVGERLRRRRLELSEYERGQFRDLGRAVAHAVEATARNFGRGETEEEIAGQLGHRLLHHRIDPVYVQVAADDRFGEYRRCGFRDTRAHRRCLLLATGERDGLFVTAARTVSFGEPDPTLRADFDAATRLSAAYVTGSRPGVPLKPLFDSTRQVLPAGRADAVWRAGPPGYFTGRSPAEAVVGARPAEAFERSQAVVWQAGVGPALSCDTVLVADGGGETVTAPEDWPSRVIRLSGQDVPRPDILVRKGTR